MDGLSAAATFIAVIGAASKTGKCLGKLSHLFYAKDEIHNLITEVSHLQTVLSELAAAMSDHEGGPEGSEIRPETSAHVQNLLSTAKQKLLQLNEIIEYQLIRETNDLQGKNVARIAWLRERHRVQRLQEQIRNIRTDLATVLTAKVSSQVAKIEIMVRAASQPTEVPKTFRDFANEASVFHANMAARVHERQLSQGVERILHQMSQQHNEYRDILQTITTANQIAIEAQNSKIETSLVAAAKPSRATARDQQIHEHFKASSMLVRRSQNQFVCDGGCGCSCHQTRRITTPSLTKSIIGCLVFGFSGVSRLSRHCNVKSCRRQSKPTAFIHYSFPTWLVAKMIVLHIANHPVFYATLRVPRIVPRSSDIMQFTIRGHTEGIKALLMQGKASPFDVDNEGGWTALHYAVNHGNAEATKLLLDAGADPFMEDSWADPKHSVDRAWDFILAQSSGNTAHADFRALFTDTDNLEDRDFSRLHMAIFGLIPDPLETILDDPKTNINHLDASGSTALCWAAIRGDIESVRTLIEYNANPEISNLNGELPLHWAMKSGNPDCVKVLVECGSDVTWKNLHNITPLHWASFYQNDTRYVEPLLEAGADIEALDDHCETGLMFAAGNNNTNIVRYLLDKGAEIDTTDPWGTTPLAQAIQFNCHETLQLLLDRCANHGKIFRHGNTLLHLAALEADLLTMNILRDAKLQGLDPALLNNEGKTAAELMKNRSGAPPDLRKSFRDLVQSHTKKGNAGKRGTAGKMPEVVVVEVSEGLEVSPEVPVVSVVSEVSEVQKRDADEVFEEALESLPLVVEITV